jgi:hypothetical protein
VKCGCSVEASPTSEESVKAVLAGIRRTVGAAPGCKKAATADLLLGMVASGNGSFRALRDRAVLLLGFAMARAEARKGFDRTCEFGARGDGREKSGLGA